MTLTWLITMASRMRMMTMRAVRPPGRAETSKAVRRSMGILSMVTFVRSDEVMGLEAAHDVGLERVQASKEFRVLTGYRHPD